MSSSHRSSQDALIAEIRGMFAFGGVEVEVGPARVMHVGTPAIQAVADSQLCVIRLRCMVPAGLEAMRDALEALADADVIERRPSLTPAVRPRDAAEGAAAAGATRDPPDAPAAPARARQVTIAPSGYASRRSTSMRQALHACPGEVGVMKRLDVRMLTQPARSGECPCSPVGE